MDFSTCDKKNLTNSKNVKQVIKCTLKITIWDETNFLTARTTVYQTYITKSTTILFIVHFTDKNKLLIMKLTQ